MTRTLLTSDHLAKWRRRIEEIAQEEQALAVERKELEQKLNAVAILFGGMPKFPTEPETPQHDVGESKTAPKSRRRRVTWPSEITKIFDAKAAPLSFQMLKDELEKGPLAGEYEKSEKGFYHAISRLQHRGYIKKHNGWLFRSEDLDEHLRKVAAGEINDLVDANLTAPNRVSPMGEAVKMFLDQHPKGVTSRDVLEHLKQDERFVETLTRNATGAYNVISRLAQRNEIRKEGRMLYPLKENEPPKGGSETEEAATSSKPPEREHNWGPLSNHS